MERSLKHLEEEVEKVIGFEHTEIVSHITSLVESYEKMRMECLNLNASASIASPQAYKLMSLGLRLDSSAEAVARIGRTHLGGHIYFDRIFLVARELAKKLFKAKFAECRLISAAIANCISIKCLTNIGDPIMALPAFGYPQMGHHTCREAGFAGYRGLKITDVPLDEEKTNIDVDAMAKIASKVRPKMILIGSPHLIFPYPLREIKEIADDVGAYVMFDGAHILGLVAGGKFQDPLREGTDLLIGSAQKVLSSPLAGIALTNNDELGKRMATEVPNHIDTIAGAKVAALAVTLSEWLEYGKEYADQIVKNAKALAKALDEKNFTVLGKNKGYTESHIVLVDTRKPGGGVPAVGLLEEANILCYADSFTKEGSGIRFGTTEITRIGMKEHDMTQITDFVKRVIIDKESPKRVAKEVTDFRKRFGITHYC